MGKNYAIILAGGQGLRMGESSPKQFLPLAGRPVILWSLELFGMMSEIDGVIPVIPAAQGPMFDEILSMVGTRKVVKIVHGGLTRHESSYNAVRSMDFGQDDILLIHDAARPFVTQDIVRNCLGAAVKFGAAGVYVKAVDTISELREKFVIRIPERSQLFITQTPQAFKYRIIRESHDAARNKGASMATDDVQLAIDAGFSVKAVEGDHSNIKITTQLDYEIARFIAEKK
jgi:2-C-methyl-D-erythritol 4-phosphate cytidylyltransferase